MDTRTARLTVAAKDPMTGGGAEGYVVRVADARTPGEAIAEGCTDKVGELEVSLADCGRPAEVAVAVFDATGRELVATRAALAEDVTDARVEVRLPYGACADGRQLTLVAGEPVDLAAAARLSTDELRRAFHVARRGTRKKETLARLGTAFPFLLDPPGDCGEGYGDSIRQLLLERRVSEADLDEVDADEFPAGTTVRTFFTAGIMVRYTTDSGSPHAVNATTPSSDTPYNTPSGIAIGTLRSTLTGMDPANTEVAPTYVQKVGLVAQWALDRILAAPFSMRDPRNGAARLEYRILAQAVGVGGQTQPGWAYVEVAPSLGENALLGTVPHEMFHQVQYRYNNVNSGGSTGFTRTFREGSARLVEDSLYDPPNRYAGSAEDLLDAPWSSLVEPSVSAIRYAAGLLWKYVSEQHSVQTTAAFEPAIGLDAHRLLLERMATVAPGDPGLGYVSEAIRNARSAMPWYGHFDRFFHYDAARTELGSHETTWGNFLVANYLHGLANPVGDARFDYLEDEFPAPVDAPATKLAQVQAAVDPADVVTLAQGTSVTRTVTGHLPWAARYYRITLGGAPAPRLLRVAFNATMGLADPLVQILRIGPGGTLVDIARSDSTSYTKTVSCAGLDSVVVIVSSRDGGGNYTLGLTEVASGTDVMVTRWNTVAGREYEVDPRGWAWTWVSPDIMVDNNGDGLADPEVFFDENNVLKIRLRNKGNAAVTGITVDFWYQKATPFLTSAGWIPMTDLGGNPSRVTGETLGAAGTSTAERWFAVNWRPLNDGTNHPHWCVKARVTVAGDLNSDNKVVLSNFGAVKVRPEGDRFDLQVRFPDIRALSHQLQVVPRGDRWRLARPLAGAEKALARDTARSPRGSVEDAMLPDRIRYAAVALAPGAGRVGKWDGRRSCRPVPDTFYPVDVAALPPGADPRDLVTVAHVVDGRAVGGVTYQVVPDDGGGQRG